LENLRRSSASAARPTQPPFFFFSHADRIMRPGAGRRIDLQHVPANSVWLAAWAADTPK